jgi:predicted nucleic acid-binding Zn ribbon protein
MHRIGTTRNGDVVVEMSSVEMEKMQRASMACAEVADCGLGLCVAAPAVPAEQPVEVKRTYCEICGREIGEDRLFKVTCSQRCDKAKRKAVQRAKHQRRKDVLAGKVVAPPARTCMICGNDMTGRNPRSKTCSRRCAQEKNRRYAREWYAKRTRRHGAKAATPLPPRPPKPAPPAEKPAQVAAKAPLSPAKARRLAMIRAVAQRRQGGMDDLEDDSDAGAQVRESPDAAVDIVRETARQMKADDGL